MVHTVGIIGARGNVGAPATAALAKSADAGKIKLVVFHREGSIPKDVKLGKNAEYRVLGMDDPVDKITAAVKGINVFICAVGFDGLPHEPNLVEGLSKSSDLVTYIPSIYSTTWTEGDKEDPQLGPILAFLEGGWNKAIELGVPVTPVFAGVFDLYWFEVGFVGSPIKDNAIWANKAQMDNKIPITALSHLGAAIDRIATSDPQSIKGKEYAVTTFWPTGKDLLDLYTKLNGKQAHVKDFTTADRDALVADGANFGPPKVGYWDKWEANSFEYHTKIEDKQYDGPGLEEIAKRFVAA